MPYVTDRWAPWLCGAEDCPCCLPGRRRWHWAADLWPLRARRRAEEAAAAWDAPAVEEVEDDAQDCTLRPHALWGRV
jgi:hypothetical protein